MKPKILIAGALAMATALPALAAEGDPVYNYTLIEADIAEIDDTTVGAFDAQGWVGGDYNRFWWKTEGEFADGDFEGAEVQALYSRYISKFWDAQIGVRYDLEPKGETYGVIGLQGLAPYKVVNRGMARTFQLCRPFVGMNLLENVLVACMSPRAHQDHDKEERARHLLEQVGLGGRGSEPVETLPYGDLRRLEIARALATRPGRQGAQGRRQGFPGRDHAGGSTHPRAHRRLYHLDGHRRQGSRQETGRRRRQPQRQSRIPTGQ